MESFPAPRPETVLGAFGEPPLILTPAEFAPFALPLPAPPGSRVAPLLPFAFASEEPPGTPGFFPSGEIVTRAARFPGGGATGAGGPGVAERAISVCPDPLGDA